MSRKRKRAVVPSVVTFVGVFLGLLCITWAPDAPYAAAVALIFAALADLFDGMIARILRVESDFGVQIDSLADFVNSGVAPALLIYHWALKGWVVWGVDIFLVVVLLYVIAAGSRLARFNLNVDEEKPGAKEAKKLTMFAGIPTPAAALLLATIVMTHAELNLTWMREKYFVVPYMLLVAVLMVSKIPYRSFKSFKTKVGPFIFGGSILGGLTVLVFGGPGGAVLLSIMLWYILTGLFFWVASLFRSEPS